MNFIKIKNTCEGCPYLNTPAIDLSDADKYFTCRLTYANTYDLEHFQDICPIKNLHQVLTNFVIYQSIEKGNDEIDFKEENKIIWGFMEERL